MYVLVQVLDGTSIRVDNLLHILRTHFTLHPCTRTGHQSLCLELIRVQEVPTQGFGIVGFVGYIGEDEDAGFGAE
jgi:hypothetical protein